MCVDASVDSSSSVQPLSQTATYTLYLTCPQLIFIIFPKFADIPEFSVLIHMVPRPEIINNSPLLIRFSLQVLSN